MEIAISAALEKLRSSIRIGLTKFQCMCMVVLWAICICPCLAVYKEKHSDDSAIPTIIASIGNVCSALLYLAPIYDYVQVYKGDLDRVCLPACVMTLLNSSLWVVYATPAVTELNYMVLIVSAIGVVLEASYLLVYLISSPYELRIKILKYLCFGLAVIGIILTCAFLQPHEKRKTFFGILCVVSGIAMYAAPFYDTIIALWNKNAEKIPVILSSFGMLNTSVWLAYGVLTHDKFIMIQDSIGLAFSALQVASYFVIVFWCT